MIITAAETILKSNLPDNFPTGILCKNLTKWEKLAFNNCLGYDFYNVLVADLFTPSSITDFVDTLVLVDATYYEFENVVYLYTAGVETVTGVDMPNCSDNWTIQKKFITDCYNNVWDNGLCDYIATYLHFRVLPFAKNIMYERSNTQRGGSYFDFKLYNADLTDIKLEVAECFELVKCWLQDDEDDDTTSCDWSSVEFLNDDCGNCTNEESNSRIGWLY